MIRNDIHEAELNAPVQSFKARVELHRGSTLEKICNCGETLNDFTIERTGAGKFFGFGICQKLKANLMDDYKELNITKEHTIEVSFGVGCDFIYPFPLFYVEEAPRDSETNDITITAYDALYKAEKHTVSELEALPENYTIEIFLAACAKVLDLPYNISAITDGSFSTAFPNGANFDGTESIRQALDAIAEATQSIYYVNNIWELTFKRLDKSGDAVITIDRGNYFELITSGAQTLGSVVHTTQLGDGVTTIEPGEIVDGVTQYIRDNPFWDLREDIADLVEAAQAAVSGLTIEQFECDWYGNYLLEIGDKIKLITKDNTELFTYFLDDTLSFNGAIEQQTSWAYSEDEAETADNPTSLGEALNKTYARVDKVNREVSIVSSISDANKNDIAAIRLNTESISASIQKVEKYTKDTTEAINNNFETLSKQVSAKVSAEDVRITVESELSKGVDKVQTSTGFTFNEEGLTVSKSGSEMTTQITEDGMTISREGQETLVADNIGVKAENLHATTYLIVGNNSRFEDYGSDRTGCFWIGG